MQKASIAASLGLSLVLASCSGGAHSTAPIPPTIPQAAPTAAPVAQSAPSAPVAYGAETTTGAVLHGPAKAGTVDFGVLVTMRDPVGLVNYAREVNDREFDVALHVVFQNRKAHDDYQVAPRHNQFLAEQKFNWAKVRVFDSDLG